MEEAILFGPFIGELGWCLLRFAPYAIWKKKVQYKNRVKLVVMTRPERFDLYGNWADILVPLRIEGDYSVYKGECFRAMGLDIKIYRQLAENFRNHFSTRFKILEHIYPKIDKTHFLNKNQYSREDRAYDFKPRKENKKLVDTFVPNSKSLIILGPRFRKGFKRNWPHWEKFYDLISKDIFLQDNFHFIICGKEPEYVPDKQNRFFDINNIPLSENSSLIGLTIEVIRKSILTVGSQSAIPNISMILGTEVLEWGDEPHEHTKVYNVMNTKVNFIVDRRYEISPEKVLGEMKQILSRKLKERKDYGSECMVSS